MGSGSKIKFGYVPFIALGVSAARCGGTCYAYPLFTAPQAQQSILKD